MQEALTNVAPPRRDGARRGRAVVAGADGSSSVEVIDDGAGAAAGDQRRRAWACVGMRERAETTGGRCDDRAAARRRLPGRRDMGGDGVIRVVLADDQQLVRAGFRVLLDAEDDIEVVGEAGDGAAALELVRRQRPDVVLMDIRMPGVDGLAATRAITRRSGAGAACKVLILTTFELDEYVFEALRAGRRRLPRQAHRAGGAGARRARRRRRRGAAVAERDPPADRRVRRRVRAAVTHRPTRRRRPRARRR